MLLDFGWPELEQQSDRLGHRIESHEVERDHLEPPRTVSPRRIVFEKLRVVPARSLRPPADFMRLEFLYQLFSHVSEADAPGGHEPFLRATREHIDVCLDHVERQRAEPLDPV